MRFNLSLNQLSKLDKGQINALKVLEDTNSYQIVVCGLDETRKDNPLGIIIQREPHKQFEYLVNRKGIPGFYQVGVSSTLNFGMLNNFTKKFLANHPDEYYEQEK